MPLENEADLGNLYLRGVPRSVADPDAIPVASGFIVSTLDDFKEGAEVLTIAAPAVVGHEVSVARVAGASGVSRGEKMEPGDRASRTSILPWY